MSDDQLLPMASHDFTLKHIADNYYKNNDLQIHENLAVWVCFNNDVSMADFHLGHNQIFTWSSYKI